MSIAPIITLQQPKRLIVGAGTIGEVADWVGEVSSTLVIASPITGGFILSLIHI